MAITKDLIVQGSTRLIGPAYVGYVYGGYMFGNISGNAATADKWNTSRSFTIGNSTKSVDGSGDVSWPLGEISPNLIGAYLPLSGGTMTGDIIFTTSSSALSGNGLTFKHSSTTDAHISSDNNGALGLYGASKVVIRPSVSSSTSGLEITSSTLKYNTNEVWDDNNINYRQALKTSYGVIKSWETPTQTSSQLSLQKTNTSGKYYGVVATKDGFTYVNVPWTDTCLWETDQGRYALVPKDYGATASGDYSISEGERTAATGEASHAEGINSENKPTQIERVTGSGTIYIVPDLARTDIHVGSILYNGDPRTPIYSMVTSIEYRDNTITVSKTFGRITDPTTLYLVKQRAAGIASHTEGGNAIALGDYSHTEGYGNVALGDYSHAEGMYDDDEGRGNIAEGNGSHAEGILTWAGGTTSHAEGKATIASGEASHTEGSGTTASSDYSHAEGSSTTASGKTSHAEGKETIASGDYSHAEGHLSYSNGIGSHAEGSLSRSNGDYSHAENSSIALGKYSHSEGMATVQRSSFTVSGTNSSSNGLYRFTTNVPHGLHIGDVINYGKYYAYIINDANGSIPESFATSAPLGSSAISNANINIIRGAAVGYYSHVEGSNTITKNSYEHAQGSYNYSHYTSKPFGYWLNTIHSVGIGTSADDRKNAVEIMQNGDIYIYGVGNYDGKGYNQASGQYDAQTLQNYLDEFNTTTAAALCDLSDRIDNINPDTPWVYGSGNGANNAARLKYGGSFASGQCSVAEGIGAMASGAASHAEGFSTGTSGDNSHAEGTNTRADGVSSHAEGFSTIASGDNSHAEGSSTIASGTDSHAEGFDTRSIGNASHAEGSGGNSFNIQIQAANANMYQYTATNANTNLRPGNIVQHGNTYALVTVVSGAAFGVDRTLSNTNLPSGTTIRVFVGVAWGDHSHSEGLGTTASGNHSHAEGEGTITMNIAEHAEGSYNYSNSVDLVNFGDAGNTVHSIGIGTAENDRKNAFEIMQNGNAYLIGVGNYDGTNPGGSKVHTLQDCIGIWEPGDGEHSAKIQYNGSEVKSAYSVSIGYNNVTTGKYSFNSGVGTYAFGLGAHAEGQGQRVPITITGAANATQYTITVNNRNTILLPGLQHGGVIEYNGSYAVIIAYSGDTKTLSSSLSSSALSSASGFWLRGISNNSYSHSEGAYTSATGIYSHSEGLATFACGEQSHAEGRATRAIGDHSHAEGAGTKAIKNGDHAEGYGTIANGQGSSGGGAHAEGGQTTALAWCSHTEGYHTQTSNIAQTAHAEGNFTSANGMYSHSEGDATRANGEAAHAEGTSTIAFGDSSHTSGVGTKAWNQSEFAIGQYNISRNYGNNDNDRWYWNYGLQGDKHTVFSIGIGTSTSGGKNAIEVMQNGDVYVNGVGNYDGISIENVNTLQAVVNAGGGGGGNAGNSKVFYGTCASTAGTVNKVVDCDDFTSADLVEGVMVIVKFSVKNTGAVANLTLNVNGTGAKGIRKIYSTSGITTLTSATELAANAPIPFIYNGTYWVVAGLDYNSSWSGMTDSELKTGTATTARVVTAKVLRDNFTYAKVTSSGQIKTIEVCTTPGTDSSTLYIVL